nr:hypothetical protein [Tanacetum cinerariifolium]
MFPPKFSQPPRTQTFHLPSNHKPQSDQVNAMVASISMWSIRSSQEEIDVYEAYATQEALFSLKIHYVGCFTESLGRNFLKPDMNLDTGLYALGNDDDVRIMSEYIRLGYKMIEVYIEHDKPTVFTYIEAAYNTPSKKCVIMEYPEGNNAPQTKLKPRRAVSGNCAKKLSLGWKENDANEICKSGTRHEDGESSQPKTTTDTDPVLGLCGESDGVVVGSGVLWWSEAGSGVAGGGGKSLCE